MIVPGHMTNILPDRHDDNMIFIPFRFESCDSQEASGHVIAVSLRFQGGAVGV